MHHSQSAPIILGICLNNDYNLQFPHHHVRSVPFLNWTYQNKILLWWMQAGFHLFLYNTVLVDVWNGSLLLWTLQIHIYTYKWVCLTSVTFKTSFLISHIRSLISKAYIWKYWLPSVVPVHPLLQPWPCINKPSQPRNIDAPLTAIVSEILINKQMYWIIVELLKRSIDLHGNAGVPRLGPMDLLTVQTLNSNVQTST